MQLKGILVGLATFALALSLVPTAAAGIPIPKSAVEAIALDGVGTAGDVSAAFADDSTAIGMELEMAVTYTATGIGERNEIYVANTEANNVGLIVLQSAGATGVASFGFAAQSSQTASGALGGVGFGTFEAAQTGIDAGAAFGVSTQRAAEHQLSVFGATTQSVASDLGAVQTVVTQGTLSTYNFHAAPAACIVAGVAADLSGMVSAQQSCDLLLRS